MTRDQALALLDQFTKSPNLRKHGLAVEAAMRHYAGYFKADPDEWGVVGLLHDFDYELHPTMDEHPQKGADLLRKQGVPEAIIQAVLAHAPHTGVARDNVMKRAIFAVDELAGFIIAVALIMPNRSLSEVTVERVLKRLKQPSFAAKVNREEISQGAAELGLTLEQHIGNVLKALQDNSKELGL